MNANWPAPAEKSIRINPVLDFTQDTAYVAVKVQSATGTDQIVVMTSGRQMIPWNEEAPFGDSMIPAAICPSLLEPRWTSQSILAFQNGTQPPAVAQVYHSVRNYLQKYLGFRHSAEYDLVTLWIMGTYLKPLFKCYPLLFFNAPHESGKSRALEVVSQLALNGKWFGEITPAAFRRCSEYQPTFCLDEVREVGLKRSSPLISILLNVYNSTEMMLTAPFRHSGWLPAVFKVTAPVALGNVEEIKNEALKSRTIQIRIEYDPSYKNIILPGVFQPEPAQIRDMLYSWFLTGWQWIKEQYLVYPEIPALSARETDSYKPLLAIAALVGPETVETVIQYAVSARAQKIVAKKATDDRLDLLLFLKSRLESMNLAGDLPAVSNKELAESYARQNKLRPNYRSFIEMVTALGVVADIKNHSGSKQLILNRAEIENQLRLIEMKS